MFSYHRWQHIEWLYTCTLKEKITSTAYSYKLCFVLLYSWTLCKANKWNCNNQISKLETTVNAHRKLFDQISQLALKLFDHYTSCWLKNIFSALSETYSGTLISRTLDFSKTHQITRTNSRFPWTCYTVILPPSKALQNNKKLLRYC